MDVVASGAIEIGDGGTAEAGRDRMFFSISKIGWLIVQPLGLVAMSFAAALLLSFFHFRRLTCLAAAFGLAVTLIGGQTNTGRMLLQPLENEYPRPSPVPQSIAGIIVLGGGFDGHVTQARGGFELGESGDRFVETLRLARIYPAVPIIVSGGEASLIGTTEGDASIARRFFTAYGVDANRLMLEDRSMNTYQNAAFTNEMMPPRTGKWLLVTSAFHMPRAVGAFRKVGRDVVPWPVDYRTRGNESWSIGRDDPIQAFAELNLAMREWIGLNVYRWTGRIHRRAT